MELRIATQMDPGVLPEVQWNNEELKKEITDKAEEYKNIAYTAERSAEMKKDRAKLNALVNAFGDQRKQVKKFYSEPYSKFEDQVKEVLAPAREAIALIDKGLAEIEKKYREDKKTKMLEFYSKHVGDLKSLVPFDRTVKEEYYKRSFTDKKLEQAYIDLFGRFREDIKALDELPERFRDKALLKYAESFSLSDSLREGKRLEELEASMEEYMKKKAAAAKRVEEQGQAISSAPVHTPKQQESEPDAVKEQDTAESVMSLDFRAWGTKAQLMGLRQYMIDNNIKFGKVE